MNAPACLFCAIVSGERSATLVAESENAVAFNDISPVSPVHVLVVPRRHVQNVTELAEHPDELVDVVRLASRVAEQEGLDQGWRLVTNTGSEAGQLVYHAHLHVVGGRKLGWPPG